MWTNRSTHFLGQWAKPCTVVQRPASSAHPQPLHFLPPSACLVLSPPDPASAFRHGGSGGGPARPLQAGGPSTPSAAPSVNPPLLCVPSPQPPAKHSGEIRSLAVAAPSLLSQSLFPPCAAGPCRCGGQGRTGHRSSAPARRLGARPHSSGAGGQGGLPPSALDPLGALSIPSPSLHPLLSPRFMVLLRRCMVRRMQPAARE